MILLNLLTCSASELLLDQVSELFFFAKEVSEPVARFSEMLRVFGRTSCCWIRLRKIRMCLMQVIHTYLEWIVV